MKLIEVSDRAFNDIEYARKGEDREIVVTNIANSQSILASLIQAGRDDESINVWTDDLLRVMATIADYNDLYSAIAQTTDNRLGNYRYEEQPDKESEEQRATRKRNERIGANVVLWLSENDIINAIDELAESEGQVEESEIERWKTLHGVTGLLVQIKNDVKE